MRCCYRPSLLAAAAACLLSASSVCVSADRVLVLASQQDLVRDAVASPSSSASAAFSPAGLAQLAMDALRLSSGKLVRLSDSDGVPQQVSVQSPAVHNVFKHVDAYAMVFVDGADAAVLNSVDAASAGGYHKVFDLTTDAAVGSTTKIPGVLATALKQSVGAELLCAGSASVCQSGVLPAVDASQTQLERVYSKHAFLDSNKDADKTLARELAQTQQLTDAIKTNNKSPAALFAVQFSSLSSLSSSKQLDAREAVTNQIQELLTALQTKYPSSSGAQVVATGGVSSVSAAASAMAKLGSVVEYSRMLLSFSDPVSGSLDDDDSDDATSVNGTASDVTMEDIAEYQIILWTSVVLGAVLILVIIAMCNMAPKRDSLLYAKFTTSNGSRKFD